MTHIFLSENIHVLLQIFEFLLESDDMIVQTFLGSFARTTDSFLTPSFNDHSHTAVQPIDFGSVREYS